MKRTTMWLLVLLLVCLSLTPLVSQAAPAPRLWVNGSFVTTDVDPIIEKGRTLVPLRVITESLGCQVDYYHDDSRRVRITLPKATGDGYPKTMAYDLYPGQTQVYALLVSDDNIPVIADGPVLDVPMRIVNDRSMVPLRFIAEAMGSPVNWDQANRVAIVGKGYQSQGEAPAPKPISPTTNPINQVPAGVSAADLDAARKAVVAVKDMGIYPGLPDDWASYLDGKWWATEDNQRFFAFRKNGDRYEFHYEGFGYNWSDSWFDGGPMMMEEGVLFLFPNDEFGQYTNQTRHPDNAIPRPSVIFFLEPQMGQPRMFFYPYNQILFPTEPHVS